MEKFFEDFVVGEVFETSGRTITEADIVNFAGISGDFNRIHIDEEYAKKTIYGTRIAHGLLIISVVSGLRLRTNVFEASLIALYGIDNLRFIAPVKIGDTIRAKITVIKKEQKRKGGLLTLKHEVFNQRNELVAVFDLLLLVSYKNQ
ncbi:MaoC/PaaZ C-terminal domain-containing protein [Caldisphaera sp.]|uniref:MaoC/PaaZ C-terminal domain-containing protein n=1 Tax=Caldisphaera sp. TaxID=2060322 RepID=UPI0025C549C0|nr:MaoC/PaaZ C-terminal domain-containing protein [Caldisphaera sp.]